MFRRDCRRSGRKNEYWREKRCRSVYKRVRLAAEVFAMGVMPAAIVQED